MSLNKEEKETEESSGEEKQDVTKATVTSEASKENQTEISEKKAAVPKKSNVCVKKRDGCCCDCCEDPDHEECCHHHHCQEHGCHEGCCCGHEGEHEHCHHENEDCCHHHGHHHGFCHEWGEECCGEHHNDEHCGEHCHGHHHEGDHEHCHHHCHGECCHHEEEEPECCCDCCCHKRCKTKSVAPKRSDVPVGYHCHDMVSKEGIEKTKRFCVPVYGHTNVARDTIVSPSVVKKQTVHVGYGYASGDNYRLGYQEGGMGGLASSFTGQVGADHGGNFDASDNFNKKSDISQTEKRNFGSHGYGSFNTGMMHGSATPYGHPVTHPGFTTMGFPGHALASQDLRNSISHPKVRRQTLGQDIQDQSMIQQQMNMGQMEMGPGPQMEQSQRGYPGYPESDPMQMQMQAMQQEEEMQGSVKSMLPSFPNEQPMSNYQQMQSSGQFKNNAQFVGGGYFNNFD